MPMGDSYSEHGRFTRALLFGKDKTKKTWFSLRAARDGYNVILLDGDDGSGIIQQLPLDARKRVLIVNSVNLPERAVFSRFVAQFCRPNNEFLWDETEKRTVPLKMQRNPEHSYIYFCPSKLTANDVVVLDSWTALAASTQIEWANEMNVDLSAIEKEGDQFNLLNFQSRFLDYVLNQLHTLPCHVIVIGHETIYEKWEGKGKDRKLVSQTTQMISSTGPHAAKVSKHFEVLHFKRLSSTAFKVDTSGDKDRAGGCRILPPAIHDWNAISPQTIFATVGSKPTGEPCHGAIWIAPGAEIPELLGSRETNGQAKQGSNAVVGTQSVSTPATILQSKGNSVLMKLKR